MKHLIIGLAVVASPRTAVGLQTPSKEDHNVKEVRCDLYLSTGNQQVDRGVTSCPWTLACVPLHWRCLWGSLGLGWAVGWRGAGGSVDLELAAWVVDFRPWWEILFGFNSKFITFMIFTAFYHPWDPIWLTLTRKWVNERARCESFAFCSCISLI